MGRRGNHFDSRRFIRSVRRDGRRGHLAHRRRLGRFTQLDAVDAPVPVAGDHRAGGGPGRLRRGVGRNGEGEQLGHGRQDRWPDALQRSRTDVARLRRAPRQRGPLRQRHPAHDRQRGQRPRRARGQHRHAIRQGPQPARRRPAAQHRQRQRRLHEDLGQRQRRDRRRRQDRPGRSGRKQVGVAGGGHGAAGRNRHGPGSRSHVPEAGLCRRRRPGRVPQ